MEELAADKAAWVLRTGIQPSEWDALTVIERAKFKDEAVALSEQIRSR